MNGKLALLILGSPTRSRNVLERNLAEAGFELRVAADLEQVAGIPEQTPEIDVVLTGTTLSRGSWLDAVDTVEASAPGTPVVVCATEPSPELRDQVRERGAYYADLEPYYPVAVQLLIHAALARRAPCRFTCRPQYAVLRNTGQAA